MVNIVLERLGVVQRQPARSVVFWVEDLRQLAPAVAFARSLQDRYPRTHVCFVQSEGLDRAHGYAVFGLPLRPGIPILLKRLRARLVILAGASDRHAAVARAAKARATPLVCLGTAGERGSLPADLRLAPDAFLGVGAATSADDVAAFDALMSRSRRAALAEAGREPLNVRLVRRLRGSARPLFALRFAELASIDAVRDALGRPRTILCLGNGPSSEHSSLAGVRHDRLFRVNMSWKSRGLLTEPDLVFTGMADAVEALEPKVAFVFGKIQSEEKVLGGLLRSGRRLRFATAERLGLMGDRPDEIGPTNGALMLALAVALQPDELIVAGIDLFRHPEGAYPGDTRTENAYAVGHDANYELDYIASTLSRFRGKLTVLSDVLREALKLS